jgi:class 3 adenylate cyclase/tetratricopeptide (TPR) repeat protein
VLKACKGALSLRPSGGTYGEGLEAPLSPSYPLRMGICEKCGEANPVAARFCLACGSPLAAEGAQEVRKTVTVVFTDLAGSTALGERLEPEAVRRIMARYFEEMQAVLKRHGGTVEKFIGDAIMAVFGIPIVREDDALRALRAAAEMLERLGPLNDELEQEWGVRLSVRIGVNTGEVLAGDPARGQAFASGDAVNVAARLEQAAGPGEILIGESTHVLGGAAIEAKAIEPLSLKGKSEPLPAWRLLEVSGDVEGFSRRKDAPFVARSAELEQLRQALERAMYDRACILATVVGPPGIGKSRLAEELARGFEERTQLLVGRCLPYGEGITYWPLAEVVKQLAGDEPAKVLPQLLAGEDNAELVADRIGSALGLSEGGAQPEEIFWAFRKLFETIARERPLVLVIDDLHWAESTLLDLLEYVAGFATDAPIFLLCLARADLFEQRPSWAAPKQNSLVLMLPPLSEEDAHSLIAGLLEKHDLPEALRGRIAEAAEGNPLFIEQLLALNADANDGELLVPPTIQALLAARVDRLGESERAVLERASVEGRTFHRGSVVELLEERERAAVGAQLIALVRKEFVRPDRAVFGGDDAFRFGHGLIRDAAYETIPKQQRVEFHQRFANWLERVTGERVSEYEEIVGYHYEQALRYRKELGPLGNEDLELARRAGDRLSSAGRRALALGDVVAAGNLLGRAADAHARDEPTRLRLLPELGDALAAAGRIEEARALLAGAVYRARELGLDTTAARADLALLELEAHIEPEGWSERALPRLRTAITVLESSDDAIGLARAWQVMVSRDVAQGVRMEKVTQTLTRAAGKAGAAGLRREQAMLRSYLTGALFYDPTPAEEALAAARTVLLEVEAFPAARANALANIAGLLAMTGGFPEARQALSDSDAIFEEFALKWDYHVFPMRAGFVELLAEDPVAAEVRLRQGLDVLTGFGERFWSASFAAMLAEALYRQDRFDEAEELAAESERLGGRDDADAFILTRQTLAKLLAARGKPEEGLPLGRKALAAAERSGVINHQADAHLSLSEVLLAAGETTEATGMAAEALALYERKGNLPSSARTRLQLAKLSATG